MFFFCFRGKIGNKAGTNIRLLPKTFVVVKSCKTSGWIRGTLREAGIVSARFSLVKAATTEQPLQKREQIPVNKYGSAVLEDLTLKKIRQRRLKTRRKNGSHLHLSSHPGGLRACHTRSGAFSLDCFLFLD